MTGIIRGLENNAFSQASSVEILTNTDGFGVGLYSGAISARVFGVTDSVLVSANYTSQGGLSPVGFVQDSTFTFETDYIGLTNLPNGVTGGNIALSNLVITAVTPAVPLPASLPLLLGSFAVGGVVLRYRSAANRKN